MNDPNGLIQWNGRYHLFYQYNPDGPFHRKLPPPHTIDEDRIRWGHAVSQDLVRWTDLPVALTPSPDGPDADGCLSGCAVVDDNGVPMLVYTGERDSIQRPCVATTTDLDFLTTWRKHANNPVIPEPPEGLEITGFRDHCVWREEDAWYQLIGSGLRGVGGTVLLYRSSDLLHWEYLHPLYVGSPEEPIWAGSMWECPDFFPLGDKHVLIVSGCGNPPAGYAVYYIGTYADHRFTPEHQGVLDAGNCFYAPQSMCDNTGRRLLWGWLREKRDQKEVLSAGWAGVMSLPRVLTLGDDKTLGIEPPAEIRTLRQEYLGRSDIELTKGPVELHHGRRERPNSLEIIVVTTSSRADEMYISICCPTKEVRVTCGRRTRVFLDCCVVEAFIDDETVITERIYPGDPENLVVTLNGSGHHASAEVWTIGSIWTGRRGQ